MYNHVRFLKTNRLLDMLERQDTGAVVVSVDSLKVRGRHACAKGNCESQIVRVKEGRLIVSTCA